MRASRSRAAALVMVAAGAVVLGGCTVDGTAVKAGGPAGTTTPTVSVTSSAAPSSTSPSTSVHSTARSTSASTTSEKSPETTSSAASGMAAQAWTMTCHTYRRLTPDEQKEMTAELGRRLHKKQLIDNDRSFAIVNSFCNDGLVRNSQGVRDSE